MKSTPYFRNVVPLKHPEVKLEWVERVLANPIKQVVQADGRRVYWGNIPEKDGRALRVVTLEDGETVHNAFFDRNFYQRQLRGDEPQ
ncbi:hypothetical protein C8255_22040 [filamentous cyanobacterium CCP3]|nr:hypothetical protein C8255_22040 [filamentous cyanobacterium CCP3]